MTSKLFRQKILNSIYAKLIFLGFIVTVFTYILLSVGGYYFLMNIQGNVHDVNAQFQLYLLAVGIVVIAMIITIYLWVAKNLFLRVNALQDGIKKIMYNDLVYLEDPHPVNCWEEKNCKETKCPAYINSGVKCWLLDGTKCDCESDVIEGVLGEKCKKCPVIKKQKHDEITDLIMVINLLLYRLNKSQDELTKLNTMLTINNEELGLALQDVSNSKEVINTLVKAIEARDTYTHGHSERVTLYAEIISEIMGITEEEIKVINNAAILHDIGKIGINDAILNKPLSLTEEEFAQVKKHSEIGEEILCKLTFAQKFLKYIRHHHEWYNGAGYPEGLKQEAIPMGARILAVADAYDAMTSDRPYRPGMSQKQALQIISEGSGKQWDPKVAQALLAHFNEPKSKERHCT